MPPDDDDELTPVQVPRPNLLRRATPSPPAHPTPPRVSERRPLKSVELSVPSDYVVTFPDGTSIVFRSGQPLLIRTARPVVINPSEGLKQ